MGREQIQVQRPRQMQRTGQAPRQMQRTGQAPRQTQKAGQPRQSEIHRQGQPQRQAASRREQRMREERRRKRRRIRRIYLLLQAGFICLFVVLAVNIFMRLRKLENVTPAMQETHVDEAYAGGTNAGEAGIARAETDWVSKESNDNVSEYGRSCEAGEIPKPEKRERWGILTTLTKLAENDERIATIVDKAELYPENMLEALANNQEMTDFVTGYLNGRTSDTGGLTEEELGMKYPLFLQWDPRWGYASYGDASNIGLAGCGPTSLSMALYYLTGDASLTPDKIAEYAMKNDYYMYGTGTKWALMEEVPAHYGVKSEKQETDRQLMIEALQRGQILICAVRPGDFTSAGHFIVIYGYEDGEFLINDPNCVARSRETWSYESVESQIKQMWALGK